MTDIERISYGPNPNPHKPKVALPKGAWDCHFHTWGPPDVFPYAAHRYYTPQTAPIEHWFALAEFLGLERGCVVMSNVYEYDVSSAIDAVAKSDGRLVGMVRYNPDFDDAQLKDLHAKGIRGMRINLVQKFDGVFDRKAFDHIIALAAKAGWVVALHMDPPSLLKIADEIRTMPVTTVIDNYAMIDAREGLDQPAVKTLIDLAREDHIWLKTASAYRMLYKGATFEQMLRVARAVSAASPDRVIWGTDWPHSGVFELNQMPNDGDLVDWLAEIVPDAALRRKMLVDNPKRLFDPD